MNENNSSDQKPADENTELPRQPRQYYYFYGSTDEGGANPMSVNGGEAESDGQQHPPASPAATDHDSLVGESLIPTDNELDDEIDPNISEPDFQQLLMSSGNGNGVHPLSSYTNSGNRRRKSHHKQNGSSGFSSSGGFLSLHRFREMHPKWYFVFVLVAVVLFLFILTVVFFPNSRAASVVETPKSELLNFDMPFRQIDRSEYNDPVENFVDKSLFHSSFLFQQQPDSADVKLRSREFTFPFPTGAFWTNLVLPPTADQGLSFPVVAYPYAFKWSSSKIQVSYPAQHRKEEPKAIHDYFFPDLTLGTSEEMLTRKIKSFDALSVTLKYYPTKDDNNDSRGYYETYLVQGSPYITVKYKKSTPIIQAFSTFTTVLCPRDDFSNGDPYNTNPVNKTNDDDSNSNEGDNNATSEDLKNNTRMRHQRRLKFGVCNSEEDTQNHRIDLHGIQFILESQEGMEWIIFASEPITLTFDTYKKTTVVASGQFNGVLRVALIPRAGGSGAGKPMANSTLRSETIDSRVSHSTGLQRLIYHAGVYPTSGGVSWSFRSTGSDSTNIPLTAKALAAFTGNADVNNVTPSSSTSSASGRIATLTFKYEINTFADASTSATAQKPLLMLALPHHAQSLDSSIQLGNTMFDLVYSCIKGPMRPVLGSTWSYDEPLPLLDFDGDSGSNSNQYYLQHDIKAKIKASLQQDIKLALPTMTENIYGFGKQSARLAQLIHIASKLENKSSEKNGRKNTDTPKSESSEDGTEISTIKEQAISTLRNALVALLTDKTSDYLVYDANLGGLVTSDGLLNSNADFGNGRYNDHHFHYGYVLYACAILGKFDASFVKDYSRYVDAIYFDVAHDSNFNSQDASDGVFYPGSRHKNWYDGHSFASGMFPFGNGKSQESSSEAVNCYYGAYLWSLVRNGASDDSLSDISSRTDFARLLLATEIRGAKTYWHMVPQSSTSNQTDAATVYSPQFSTNYMVGNLGMLDAVCSTWFGTQSLYVHMINFMPVTSATGELFGQKYVAREYNDVLKALGTVEMAWNGYVVSNKAIVDPQGAWNIAEKLFSPTLDSGLSKSQVLYWISTRQGFNASSESDSSQQSDDASSSPADNVPSNETNGGDNHSDFVPNGQGSNAACSSSPGCASNGLTGDCCPTTDGRFLDCCQHG